MTPPPTANAHQALPLAALPAAVARGLRGVLTDIDDTLTADGKLLPEAYDALWRLQRAGLLVIPITGRPAGWCDAIARQWPVAGVVGENGALAFWEQGSRLRRLYHPQAASPAARQALLALAPRILAAVPGSRVAADQPYRMFDLAIDFAEEEPRLDLDAARRIQALFAAAGYRATISSIHVNGWQGDYDKLSMTRQFLRQVLGYELESGGARDLQGQPPARRRQVQGPRAGHHQTPGDPAVGADRTPVPERERWLFSGDSPNDEPMFAYFPHACGVANLRDFSDQLAVWPRYLATRRGGLGFAEVADTLLALRAA